MLHMKNNKCIFAVNVSKHEFKTATIAVIVIWIVVCAIGFVAGDNVVDIIVSDKGKYVVNYNSRVLYFFDMENLITTIEFSKIPVLFEQSDNNNVIYVRHRNETYSEIDFNGNIICKTNAPNVNARYQKTFQMYKEDESNNYIIRVNRFGYEKFILIEKASGNRHELNDVSNFFFKKKCLFYIPALLSGVMGPICVYLTCTRSPKFKDSFY